MKGSTPLPKSMGVMTCGYKKSYKDATCGINANSPKYESNVTSSERQRTLCGIMLSKRKRRSWKETCKPACNTNIMHSDSYTKFGTNDKGCNN